MTNLIYKILVKTNTRVTDGDNIETKSEIVGYTSDIMTLKDRNLLVYSLVGVYNRSKEALESSAYKTVSFVAVTTFYKEDL